MEKARMKNIILKMLPKISFFGGGVEHELDEVIEYITEKDIKAGDVIYKEGDPPKDLYIILEGEMEFYILDKLVTKEGEGMLFGMSATIGIQKQMVTAVAITDVKLAVVSKKLFMTMSEKNPKLFGKIILNVARDLARDLKYLRDRIKENEKIKKN